MMAIDQTEDQADAAALLATVRNLMTGAEIDVCERIASGEGTSEPVATYDEDGEVCGYRDDESFAGYATPDEQPFLNALRNQFYAKITNFKDGRASA